TPSIASREAKVCGLSWRRKSSIPAALTAAGKVFSAHRRSRLPSALGKKTAARSRGLGSKTSIRRSVGGLYTSERGAPAWGDNGRDLGMPISEDLQINDLRWPGILAVLLCLLTLASFASAGPRCEPPCMWELWRSYQD